MNNVESFVKTHADAPTAEVLRQDLDNLLFHHPGRGGIRRGFNDQRLIAVMPSPYSRLRPRQIFN